MSDKQHQRGALRITVESIHEKPAAGEARRRRDVRPPGTPERALTMLGR